MFVFSFKTISKKENFIFAQFYILAAAAAVAEIVSNTLSNL